MRKELKKQDRHAWVPSTGTPVQAKSLGDIRSMQNSPDSSEIAPTTESQQTRSQQEKQDFNFAEMPIFAGEWQTSTPKIQAKFFPSDRSENIAQQPLQRQETEDAEPIQAKGALKAQIQQILGEACFYAAEAYHSEDDKHIVAGVQGAKKPEQKAAIMNSFKPKHFLQSFNEQLGDFLKDLSQYANAPDGKIFYRFSKYLYRLFLALAKLGQYKLKKLKSLTIESKPADKIAKHIDTDLVAIPKGNKQFNSEQEKNNAAVNGMKKIWGVTTASELKAEILVMA